MQLQLITDLDVILKSESNWNSVATEGPMLSWDWMAAWLEHFSHEATPAVIVATDDNGKWVGIAPFCIEGTSSFIRKLRFISSGKACGDYMKLIVNGDNAGRFAEQVADFLVANIGQGKLLGTIDVIELEGHATDCPETMYFCELLVAMGFSMNAQDIESCWAVSLGETFEELSSSVSKSLRRKIKAANKRLADESTHIIEATVETFDTVWDTFVDLHQRRRISLGQAGCFADSNFSSFLKQTTRCKIASDTASLIQINREQQPLAAMLLFHDNSQTMMYQSGLDPDRKQLEPGYQMIVVALKHSVERSQIKFDFLRGDEPYKTRWNTEQIRLAKVRLVPGKLTARLKDSTWRIGKSIKDCVIQFRQPNSP